MILILFVGLLKTQQAGDMASCGVLASDVVEERCHRWWLPRLALAKVS